MIGRVMIVVYPIKVIMQSGKSWFKTKSANPQADMSEEESAVDEMVASRELYGLSQEEIDIVEGRGNG